MGRFVRHSKCELYNEYRVDHKPTKKQFEEGCDGCRNIDNDDIIDTTCLYCKYLTENLEKEKHDEVC